MEALEQNSVEWTESHSELKAIFDRITLELGPPDVDFRSGSRSFKVHKKVLEKHSSVLKAKLSDVWQTSGDVLQLNEEYVEPEVVQELLTWMYYTSANKCRNCSTENAYSLCLAAHYLLIFELITLCSYKLAENITPENFYDIYTLSKHINLDFLRQKCVLPIVKQPIIYFLSPQVAKWTAEELKMFIEETLKEGNTSRVHDLILFSLPIWINSIDDRFQELENLLKLLPSEKLSSDTLFRFMETELYSKLDESHRKQYCARSYLPKGSSSTDKLYCLQIEARASYKPHCLHLSAGGNWLDYPPEHFTCTDKCSVYHDPVLGASWQKKIYFLGTRRVVTSRVVKVFSTETGEWDTSETLDNHYHHMLAAVVLDDYIYVTDSSGISIKGKSVSRYCVETKQWQALKDMQEARLNHRLVALDGFVYAIGGEVPFRRLSFRESNQDPRPERYDPQMDRWEYIAPSNYLHKLRTAVTHEGQIYVLSEAGFEAYLPETDRWIQLPAPDVCIKPSLVSIAGKLWLLTDLVQIDCHTLTSKESRRVFEFDVVKREWTRLPDLPEGNYTDLAFALKQ